MTALARRPQLRALFRGAILPVLVFGASGCTPVPPSPSVAVAPTSLATPVRSAAAPSPSQAIGGAVTARYADGLPSRMGETQVFRGQAAIDHAAQQTDETAFLVTGWVTYLGAPLSCPLTRGPFGSWTNGCGDARFSDVAGLGDPLITPAITFRFVLGEPLLGPIVVVVHVHDPRAPECETEKAICDRMMVVDRLVWRGDAATEPVPVTRQSLTETIVAAQGTVAEPYGPDSQNAGCQLPGLYLYAVMVPDDVTPKVVCAVMAPSKEALSRALDRPEGAAAALRPKAVQMESRSYLHNVLTAHVTIRWLVVENVALLIRTEADPTKRDRAFLEQLAAALSP